MEDLESQAWDNAVEILVFQCEIAWSMSARNLVSKRKFTNLPETSEC